MAWILALPGFMPFVFAVLAQMDGQHGVEVRGDCEHVVVTLTHAAATPGTDATHPHVHGPLSRMLAAFTVSSGSQPDHVATFCGTSMARSEFRPASTLPDDPGTDIPAETWNPLDTIALGAPFALYVQLSPARSSLAVAPLPARRHSLLI